MISSHPLYQTWKNMRQRCNNPRRQDYIHYGGRGIKIGQQWNSFHKFAADMGIRPEGNTLERIDTNKGYTKANCRWASMTDQSNNKRCNRNIRFNGRTLNLKQWSRELGIKYLTLFMRIERGWSIREAFTIQP